MKQFRKSVLQPLVNESMFTLAMEPQQRVPSGGECVEAKRNPISQSRLQRPENVMRIMAMVGVMFILIRLAPLTVAGVSPELHSLTVSVDGVANSKGEVGVLVFNSARGWPEHVSDAFQSKAVAAHEGRTELTITGLPTGNYAVVVLHDENGNKKGKNILDYSINFLWRRYAAA